MGRGTAGGHLATNISRDRLWSSPPPQQERPAPPPCHCRCSDLACRARCVRRPALATSRLLPRESALSHPASRFAASGDASGKHNARWGMSLVQTGIRVLSPRRQRADGGHEMVVEICEPAGSPGWIFQVAFDLELVVPANARLPLLPEARALCLFLQRGLPWAMADSEAHSLACPWCEMLHPQGKPALTDSFVWSFRQHFSPGAEFGGAAPGRAGLDAEQFKSLLQRKHLRRGATGRGKFSGWCWSMTRTECRSSGYNSWQ